MKTRTLVKVTSSLFIFAAIVMITLASQPKNPRHALMMQNIEALTTAETNTTWSCDASSKTKCNASCPSCGTYVSGTGALRGSHSCSK